ncbi:aluminum-activated malate transporter 9 isoform X2 [Jatropha curcas]|uniref:aluminum-activated malate transporter 9 isoform X2 n=1 Tax=Jatropha curcas TaxID=180498 RepID=UPI0005FB36D2|nr:aluminum-activated malate transporter 9 isoform X2 [Jatropha curcas]
MDNSKERQFLLGSFRGDVVDDDETSKPSCLSFLRKKIKKSLNELQDFAGKAWEMGRSDPRKIIFAIKMGLALAIVSLLIFWKGLYDISQYSIWAILTVIVMFEYSIGATFIKGFNRLLGTLCAGILAFCCAELSVLIGKWEEVIIVISIFVIAGNRTREYTEAVVTRLVLIAVGASVCLVVNVFIHPIWAGDALHSLVVKNFKDVANSLEGCVNGYLKCVEYERIPSRILTFQAYDDPLYNGYRSVVESTGKEDTLLGFAIWEPPHGRFKTFHYPWKNYVEVSGALRHCAFMVMALHGCILSEIQAPAERRQVFHNELQKAGAEAAKVLRELGNKLDRMEKLGPEEDVLREVHEAAEKLQIKIDERSYLLIKSENWEIGRQDKELQDPQNVLNENMQLGFKSLSETVLDLRSLSVWTPSSTSTDSSGNLFRKQTPWPSSNLSVDGGIGIKEDECRTYESASALSLATFASLLIECVARLQSLVDAFEELSDKAEFVDPTVDSTTTKKNARCCESLFRCFRFSN